MTYKLSPWSLSDLFPSIDHPELETAFITLEKHITSFEKLRPQCKANIAVSSFIEGVHNQWEWVSIPHIYHTPIYVYAYAVGQLLVLALYQQLKAEGEAFKPHYTKILSAGGSEAPANICTEAGIDIHSEVFWQSGFNVLENLVDELEKIS